MGQRFRGTDTHKVDAKGRVSIPADFRRVLDSGDPEREPGQNPSVIVLFGDTRNPWFDCYTAAAMEEIDALIEEMDDGDPDRIVLEEYFYANALTIRLDDAGRLVLTRALRERIGITDQACFQGRGKTFRIFSPDVPGEAVSQLGARLADMPRERSIASLLPSRRGRAPAE
ncbi:division/cell wall cluster transcriptional repressor MraZ [Jannaschia sp. W003]|uniref:division/cell wall cluster transcriptional repressor MraZ n=1 Tax=Jannaschia sp. W003 TaxID=2867012 RepID=UPI0021A7DBB2|nr:cell division/cell wall cluster transcriptional repressor MraZ [Jannaschia sp. W003]UWQ21108.1 cell division/cell wall cluster transcriptional repressor MraZ [Jannaschia sp. W003]